MRGWVSIFTMSVVSAAGVFSGMRATVRKKVGFGVVEGDRVRRCIFRIRGGSMSQGWGLVREGWR